MPVICSFTGAYDFQSFSDGCRVLDFKNLSGCGMYVDQHAEAVLLSAVRPYAPSGLHFIDSGNYHYMTRLFASYITEPFDLAVFDHHTDDREPMIRGMKSCGSWMLDIREENPMLRSACLFQTAYDIIKYKSSALPLYISVDKDVLSEEVLKTNWDQGDMTLKQFEDIFDMLLNTRRIIGIDICGEDGPFEDASENDKFNRAIIKRAGHLF